MDRWIGGEVGGKVEKQGNSHASKGSLGFIEQFHAFKGSLGPYKAILRAKRGGEAGKLRSKAFSRL